MCLYRNHRESENSIACQIFPNVLKETETCLLSIRKNLSLTSQTINSHEITSCIMHSVHLRDIQKCRQTTVVFSVCIQ